MAVVKTKEEILDILLFHSNEIKDFGVKKIGLFGSFIKDRQNDEAEFITDKMNELEKNAFFNDEVLKRAFVRSLEVVGEAAKRLPKDFRRLRA